MKCINIEFDGIDKCGKDSIIKQFVSICPNKYLVRNRGVLSQIAYNRMFNRNYNYEFTDGYLENTLIVYLTVDKEDWNIRCKATNEHENNKNRSDIERKIEYDESVECFEYAYNFIKENEKCNIIKINTTEMTPYNIIKYIYESIEKLNS